jgi:hypothetical protein
MGPIIRVLLCLSLGCSAVVFAGSNASDPTAAVNFTDLRLQSFDLGDVSALGDDLNRYWLEGAYMAAPGHKITYEVNYWETDTTGRDESGMESASISYKNLTPGQLSGGIKYTMVWGAEAIFSLGDPEDGIGSGTDQIAPLVGAGWNLSEKDFLITLVQYFHSYNEDDAAPQKIRSTGPRLIWIHSIPQYQAWLKIDDKFSIDHENDNSTSNILEIQVGKMLTPAIGVYVEYLNNTGGTEVYDHGVGIGMRMVY